MRQLSLLLTAIGLTLICACGKPLAAPADPAPFKAAVADYCRAKNYGMTIASITALEPTGDTATMTCRMQDPDFRRRYIHKIPDGSELPFPIHLVDREHRDALPAGGS